MGKLHLMAKPASEGARRVAQWVMTLPGGVAQAAEALEISEEWVQRIVDGDLIPGLRIGVALTKLMGVTAAMFQRPARSGWFDRVPEALAA
ncbi:hypothetical protein [Sphingomonas yabuuchiae]|uniref:hypothetical protein n=1 Tax=Sphingomonas yabuuchiae TaxID=172044 RepID=UPI000736F309|nr:hypothetical protein [Sphingomonas yabuuchiae]